MSPDDLQEELQFLRKNDGFTPSRVDRTDVVRLLLDVTSEGFERTRGRFVSAIDSLGDSDGSLLRDIFRLSDETTSLGALADRRRIHADRIGRSAATVADREGPALARLARALVTGRYAQSPLSLDVPEMHGGLVYEWTSTLIVIEERMWKETREHYRFMAEFDEMDFLTITRSYPAVVSTPTTGAFRVNTREASQGFNDHFWSRGGSGADSPMMRGETYDLKFKLEPSPDEAGSPMVNAYRAFHERSLLASIQVEFRGEVPSAIWRYERVSHFAQPGVPTSTNEVRLERGIASLRLRDVHGGLASGIAWRW